MPLTPPDAYEMAQRYFADWLTKVDDAIEIAEFCLDKLKLKDAAFLLHQAFERRYILLSAHADALFPPIS